MKHCPNCDTDYTGDEVYCPRCATLLELAPTKDSESTAVPQPAAEGWRLFISFVKRLPQPLVAILAVILLAILWPLFTGKTSGEIPTRSLSSVFSPKELKASMPNCAEIKSVVISMDNKEISTLSTRVSGITDGRKAASALGTSWYSTAVGMSAKYVGKVKSAISPSFSALVKNSKTVSSSELFAFENDWDSYVLEQCKLTNVYKTNNAKAIDLKSSAEALTSLAASVPWYPDGYVETTPGLAWKWSDGGSCKFSSWGCWHMNVIAKDGCQSGLYAAINIVDTAGTVVGYTNDSLPGLAPMQKARLEFTNTTDYRSAQFQELKCY